MASKKNFRCPRQQHWIKNVNSRSSSKAQYIDYQLILHRGESIDHLLLHCTAARDIWLLAIMLKIVVQMLGCWQGRFHHHRISRAWVGGPLCITWTIWCEQNSRIFDGFEHSNHVIKKFMLRCLYVPVVVLKISPLALSQNSKQLKL